MLAPRYVGPPTLSPITPPGKLHVSTRLAQRAALLYVDQRGMSEEAAQGNRAWPLKRPGLWTQLNFDRRGMSKTAPRGTRAWPLERQAARWPNYLEAHRRRPKRRPAGQCRVVGEGVGQHQLPQTRVLVNYAKVRTDCRQQRTRETRMWLPKRPRVLMQLHLGLRGPPQAAPE